jgi:hypothetical protein
MGLKKEDISSKKRTSGNPSLVVLKKRHRNSSKFECRVTFGTVHLAGDT